MTKPSNALLGMIELANAKEHFIEKAMADAPERVRETKAHHRTRHREEINAKKRAAYARKKPGETPLLSKQQQLRQRQAKWREANRDRVNAQAREQYRTKRQTEAKRAATLRELEAIIDLAKNLPPEGMPEKQFNGMLAKIREIAKTDSKKKGEQKNG